MYRVEWRASLLGARMPTTQKTNKEGRGFRPCPHCSRPEDVLDWVLCAEDAECFLRVGVVEFDEMV